MQLKEKVIYHEIPGKQWKGIGVDMFTLHQKTTFMDYHSMFTVIKRKEDLSTDSLILACKIIFSEYDLPKKIMSDVSGSFISDKF